MILRRNQWLYEIVDHADNPPRDIKRNPDRSGDHQTRQKVIGQAAPKTLVVIVFGWMCLFIVQFGSAPANPLSHKWAMIAQYRYTSVLRQ
jgi:hypothetical protein